MTELEQAVVELYLATEDLEGTGIDDITDDIVERLMKIEEKLLLIGKRLASQ